MPFSIIRFRWFWWNFNCKIKKSHNLYCCLTNSDVCPGIFGCAGSRVLGVAGWDCLQFQRRKSDDARSARLVRFPAIMPVLNTSFWYPASGIAFISWYWFFFLISEHRFPVVAVSYIQANIQYCFLSWNTSIRLNPSDPMSEDLTPFYLTVCFVALLLRIFLPYPEHSGRAFPWTYLSSFSDVIWGA